MKNLDLDSVRGIHFGFRLVLVGMIEAIALEMAVSAIFENEYFWNLNSLAALAWAQLGTNLSAIVLASVSFSTMLSFQQIGRPLDYLVVFVVGFSQFFSVGLLGAETVVPWCIVSGISWAATALNYRIFLATGRELESVREPMGRFPLAVASTSVLMLAVLCFGAGFAYDQGLSHWLSAGFLAAGTIAVGVCVRSIFAWWHAEASPIPPR